MPTSELCACVCVLCVAVPSPSLVAGRIVLSRNARALRVRTDAKPQHQMMSIYILGVYYQHSTRIMGPCSIACTVLEKPHMGFGSVLMRAAPSRRSRLFRLLDAAVLGVLAVNHRSVGGEMVVFTYADSLCTQNYAVCASRLCAPCRY